MKHQPITPQDRGAPAPVLDDAEIEARVFRRLEAKRRAWAEIPADAVVILQAPDDRTWAERARAWWSRRFTVMDAVPAEGAETSTEPAWPGHWRTAKYL